MTVALVRVDDRLIHGQVVIGWGRPLGARFIALVDDAVAAAEWEQDLYRMAVPPEVSVEFATVAEAAGRLAEWEARPEPGIVLAGEVATITALAALAPGRLREVNLGGVHHQTGRRERLEYVYLTDQEHAALRALAAAGVRITAQDVPSADPVPLEALA